MTHNDEIIIVSQSEHTVTYQVANVLYLYDEQELKVYRQDSFDGLLLIAHPCHSRYLAEQECIADWFFCQHGCTTPIISLTS